MRRQLSQRPAFTLTEMMVATALILFIMVIISTAFRSGIDTFSKLNTTGKLQEQLGNAQRIIQRDMSADHFDMTNSDGLHGPRLSDQRLDRVNWTPPTRGYFIAWQTPTNNIAAISNSQLEQSGLADGEGILSSRNTQSFLRFTVKLRTDTPPYDIPMYRFAQSVQGFPADRTLYPDSILDPLNSNFAGRQFYITANWAQVEYFLVSNGNQTTGSNPLPLFSLRRTMQQFPAGAPSALTPNLTVPSVLPGAPTPTRISRASPPVPAGSSPAKPNGTGDDILLNNVVSFETKFIWNAPNPAEFLTLAKQPISLGTFVAPLNAQPLSNSVMFNSGNMNDPADWPYSDLPLDSSRVTLPDGTSINRTPKTNLAWPGIGGSRQWDEDPPLYFDTWFNPPVLAPNWSVPPQDDRFAMGGVNPAATLPNQPPLRIRIKAIQFKIRIWDDKTGQTRQITIMQEV